MELFDEAREIKMWVRGNYPDELAQKLPGESVSPAEMSDSLVRLLERRLFIDDSLFDRLTVSRPWRGSDIERVRDLCSRSGGVSRSRIGSPSRVWENGYSTMRRWALGLMGVWIFTRWYPTNGPSLVLRHCEDVLFSFIPHVHQRLVLPVLSISSVFITLLFWLLFQLSKRGENSAKDDR